MTAIFDEVEFEDRLDCLRAKAHDRGMLRALHAFASPPSSLAFREGIPRRLYAVHGSMMRSPALICAELGASDEASLA